MNVQPAEDLYLDLLKRSLTDTLFVKEPDVDAENYATFVQDFINHYMEGRAVTMLPKVRLDSLQSCIGRVLDEGVPGDFIETGVWRGGASIFMRAMLKCRSETGRKVWVADSFEGLPEPDGEKYPVEAAAHQGAVMKKAYKHFAAGLEEVKGNFATYGMLDDQVEFLQGWFKDTLPVAPIGQLAVMRLDGDYYESTRDALDNLYPKLAVGGFAIIDDYGEETWTYCRQAVEDFRAAHGIQEPLVRVDSKCSYWRRSQ